MWCVVEKVRLSVLAFRLISKLMLPGFYAACLKGNRSTCDNIIETPGLAVQAPALYCGDKSGVSVADDF